VAHAMAAAWLARSGLVSISTLFGSWTNTTNVPPATPARTPTW
jgi:hypothetical protein